MRDDDNARARAVAAGMMLSSARTRVNAHLGGWGPWAFGIVSGRRRGGEQCRGCARWLSRANHGCHGGPHGGGWISMNNNTTINLTPQSDVYACGLNCCWNNIETDKSTVLAWSAGLINA